MEEFFAVFAKYNAAIWPLQLVAYAAGAGTVVLCFFENRFANLTIGGILALMWFWMGLVYHLMFFRLINPVFAAVFGALFVLQGLLFMHAVVLRKGVKFRWRPGFCGWLGAAAVGYAMLAYPAIAWFLGHRYPLMPAFGVAPCPSTIFTFGLLLWTGAPLRKRLLVIPVLWSLVGCSASVLFGVWEDLAMPAFAVAATIALLVRDRRESRPSGKPERAEVSANRKDES